MTDREADQLALLVQARWPHPEFTDVDLVVWRRDLAAVPYPTGEAAVQRLVADGREYQPRAPQLLAAVADLNAERSQGAPVEPGPLARAAEAAALAAATPPPGWRPQGRLRGPLADLVRRAMPQPPQLPGGPT